MNPLGVSAFFTMGLILIITPFLTLTSESIPALARVIMVDLGAASLAVVVYQFYRLIWGKRD